MTELEQALAAHDRTIAASGNVIWLGAEPTFTDPASSAEEWGTAALGSDKESRARRFVRRLSTSYPGGVILRTLGRQYPGEGKPRWNFGVYSRRDDTPVWQGPADPMVSCEPSNAAIAASSGTTAELRAVLGFELQSAGLHFITDLPADSWGDRLLFADHAELLHAEWHTEPQVVRPPVQTRPIPSTGPQDELAARGVYLVSIGLCESSYSEDRGKVQVEVPSFRDVPYWMQFLDSLGRAANRVGLRSLVLTGFPPPVDDTVTWNTVTPDPGVLEINMAPCPTVTEFLRDQRRLHAVAKEIGLSASRLLFNGEVVDSGGGQHLTFGGPSPKTSPFLIQPQLLPRLIAYLNQHPALSYWFAVRSVGSCGQQPRPDEVSPESFDGLSVALDRICEQSAIDPESLWRSLAPFLCDRFGNTHRCEVNVEKLWNCVAGERSCLGLVELRAFRMTRSPEDAASVATLLRALLASLAARNDAPKLVDWGGRLHDRFSLPHYLMRDLGEVLRELREHGFGLGNVIEKRLLDDSLLVIGVRDLDGAILTVRQAVEFWPVVGDLSSQNGSWRMMDASTSRIEISLKLPEPQSDGDGNWRLSVAGYETPWVIEGDVRSAALVRGIRYKSFQPQTPVAPLVEILDPLEFTISAPGGAPHWKFRLFNWRPDGDAYDGLPQDFVAAERRRNERLVVERSNSAPDARPTPPHALSECCIDLRRIPSANHNQDGGQQR